MRRVAIAGTVLAAGMSLGACESTQSKSARLEKTGKNQAKLTTVATAAANTQVTVLSKTVLHAPNGNAAVVQLKNDGPAAEVEVPVQIQVKDPAGKVVYKNDIAGLQPALQSLAYLPKGATTYWVNDQVLAVDPPKSVDVAVGREKSDFAGEPPKITLGPARLAVDSTGAYATAEVRNESKIPQLNLPIFAVALKGGKVVAAGRALIERLNPAPTKKPVTYKIFFIGDPKGATLQVVAAPTVLKEGTPPS